MLSYSFSFEAYAKNVTKCYLETTEVLLMLMSMCLPTFDIDVLIFVFKKVLLDVWSEMHLVRRNIVSTGQVLQAYKHIFGPVL